MTYAQHRSQLSWSSLQQYLLSVGFSDTQMPDNGALEMTSSCGVRFFFELLDDAVLISAAKLINTYQRDELLEEALRLCHYKTMQQVQVYVGLTGQDNLVFTCRLALADASTHEYDQAVNVLMKLHEKLSSR